MGSRTPTSQRSTPNNNQTHKHSQNKTPNNTVKSFASTSSNVKHKEPKGFTCIVCDGGHRIYDCPVFKAKGIDERMSDVTRYKLCINCLRQGHAVNNCRFRSCQEPECNERHNSLLHRPSTLTTQIAHVEESGEIVASYCNKNINYILLSTAMVEVSNPLGQQKVQVRALLDCGSQSSFVTESLKIRLSLKSHHIDSLKVIGIGNTQANNVTESCNIILQSLNNKFNINTSCFVLKELTGRLPRILVDISTLKLPENIQLADPMFNQPADIDILIGADIFWDILGNEQISLGTNMPKLRSSHLGWKVSGPINSITPHQSVHCNHSVVSKKNDGHQVIEKMLGRFWELEEVPKKSIMRESEIYCEKHFITRTTRTKTGRFCVRLLLKDTADCLGDTYKLAKRRFLNIEKRFKRRKNKRKRKRKQTQTQTNANANANAQT
ncbi:hypothetical protein PYW08_012612 [Mythimna loreyi]|uniref:Uncharacterized protein n=1 Tax=Mythimna loreyi TaxID=667449 RepID=A0ACC2Q1X5_9NEOP|nr:hypothetical protein PYW08_012612 [Mythimna loreyi]